MDISQIQHIRDLGSVTCINTTRGGIFPMADSSGDVTKGRYTAEWDDANLLLKLRNRNPFADNHKVATHCINYGIIDEVMVIDH